ncbi:MAG: trehalose-phosphatase, partial [Dehalococcoidia bacterium]
YLVNRAAVAMIGPFVRSALTRGKSGNALDEASKRVTALTQVAQHSVRITIMIIAALIILGLFDINVGPLIAGLGVVGIAVGFGAQHTVRDIIAGAFIIAEDQYRVGDVATAGGRTGLVEGLNLRRTMLRDLDGVVHYIPNGDVGSASNFSKDFSRINLDVTVAYKEDLDKVIRILNRVGGEVARDGYFGPLIVEAPRAVRVNAFGESGIDIKILGVTKPIRQWEVAGELRRRIKREFDREGIEIPYPHRTIYWGQNAHPGGAPPKVSTSQAGSARDGADQEGADQGQGDASLAIDPWITEREGIELAGQAEASLALTANYMKVRNDVLAHHPAALFIDIDGTLARINPNPSAVSITAAVRQALHTIARHARVVALTGRDVNAARGIVGLNSITYVGNHGIEWWERGSTRLLPEAEPYVKGMHDIARLASRRLREVDGVVIEDKGPTLSFHYRSAIDPEASRVAIHGFLKDSREARGLDIREGKMVVEVRPPIHVDKGVAVRQVVQEHGIMSALALGDDTTDIDTFKAIGELRESQGLHAVCIAVLGENTPDELLQRADLRARDVEDVEVFLEKVANDLTEHWRV